MQKRVLLALAAVVLVLALGAPPARGQGYIYAYSVTNTASTTITTTTETVACTLPGISTRFAGSTVRLIGTVEITTGLGTTATTVFLRRGSTTSGTLVGAANAITTAAGSTFALPKAGEDVPGDVDGQPYVLTVQQTAATGNGTVVFCELMAFVF